MLGKQSTSVTSASRGDGRLERYSVEVRERTAGLRQRTPELAKGYTRAPRETERCTFEAIGVDAILVAT